MLSIFHSVLASLGFHRNIYAQRLNQRITSYACVEATTWIHVRTAGTHSDVDLSLIDTFIAHLLHTHLHGVNVVSDGFTKFITPNIWMTSFWQYLKFPKVAMASKKSHRSKHYENVKALFHLNHERSIRKYFIIVVFLLYNFITHLLFSMKKELWKRSLLADIRTSIVAKIKQDLNNVHFGITIFQ